MGPMLPAMLQAIDPGPLAELRILQRIGIELEGWWEKPHPNTKPEGLGGLPGPGMELCSPILRPHNVRTWLAEHYPSNKNEACGMHVHVSGAEPAWAQLVGNMRPQILHTRIDERVRMRLADWVDAADMSAADRANFEERRSGRNGCCSRPMYMRHYPPSAPLTNRWGVNLDAYQKHGTVELRILPMFATPALAFDALCAIVLAFDAECVRVQNPPQPALRASPIAHPSLAPSPASSPVSSSAAPS